MPDDLHYMSATELGARYRRGELSPVEATSALLDRIDQLDGRLHAYATVLGASAMSDARRAEAELGRGEDRGPLHGIPIAVKDLCATKGVRTSCGTKVLRDRIPDHDAVVVERLRAAGAVLLGKLELTEGAYGTHHPEVIPPVNPWDASRWTGVSSSGSGVATAAGLCAGSLGSDTGGSIRFPSACCGVVGLKPTWGRVPLFGVFPLAASLDHIGPMTRSARDAAVMLQALAGFDPRDPGSRREPVSDYGGSIERGIRGVRIGVDPTYVREGVHPEVHAALEGGLERLRELGAEVRELRMPDLEDLLLAWHPLTAAEARMAHAQTFPARADDYGPGLRGLLERGDSVSASDVVRAEALRRAFRGQLEELFTAVDLIACPSFFAPAPPLAGAATGGEDPGALAFLLRFTVPFDFSGSPTISLPSGFSQEGLPLSLQLVARDLDEALLCRAGHAFEGARSGGDRHPPV